MACDENVYEFCRIPRLLSMISSTHYCLTRGLTVSFGCRSIIEWLLLNQVNYSLALFILYQILDSNGKLIFISLIAVTHPIMCDACHMENFTGFRYRCQKCHSYQLCQDCFWRGKVSGGHNNDHETREYSSFVSYRHNLSQLSTMQFFFFFFF